MLLLSNSFVVLSAFAMFMAIVLAVLATAKKSLCYSLVVFSMMIAAFAFCCRFGGGFLGDLRIDVSFVYISMVILVIIFFALALAMKENGVGFGAFISLLCAIATVAMLLCGCGFIKFHDEEPVVEEPAEQYLSEYEKFASGFTDADLISAFGYPRRFKQTSTNAHRSARVKKTKLNDAITYQNGDTEEEMIEEILSNPIYLQSFNYILQDCEIVGLSNWAKAFTQADYTTWVNGNYVSEEYHIIACRYLIVFNQMQSVERSKNWTAKLHYGLDANAERVSTIPSDSKLTANWQVYKFTNWRNSYTDTDDTFIGFSCNDGRFAILQKAAKKPAAKKNVGAAAPKADIGAAAAQADISAAAATPAFDWSQYEFFTTPEIGEYTDYAPGEIGLEVNRIPDYYGNAPVGGFGSGVDNLGAGVFQPNEPTHVYSDSITSNNTIISSGGSSSRSSSVKADHVDEHRPSSSAIPKTNTTTYSTAGTTTSSRNTGNTSVDSVNDGVVDGF